MKAGLPAHNPGSRRGARNRLSVFHSSCKSGPILAARATISSFHSRSTVSVELRMRMGGSMRVASVVLSAIIAAGVVIFFHEPVTARIRLSDAQMVGGVLVVTGHTRRHLEIITLDGR